MRILFRFFLVFFTIYVNASAADLSPSWYSKSADGQLTINVELFLSSTCPHCQKADAFFQALQKKFPDIHVQLYFINQEKNALIRFSQLLQAQQMDDYAVPSVYFCNSRWVGFDTAETTGKDLLNAIHYCKQQIEYKGLLTQATEDTLRHWANANKFTSEMSEKPTALYYTLTLAFIDSFNPCALFSFMGFLAFIFVGEQRKKQIIASSFFMLSIVVVHYFQQVDANDYFSLLPWLHIPAVLIGLVTIYFVVQRYQKKSYDTLYYSLSFFLGLITTAYQQVCVMNWSTIFEQWFNNQHFSTWEGTIYQLLYQGVYILPLVLILLIYLGFLSLKSFTAIKMKLGNIGLLFLIVLALCCIGFPFLFAHLKLSLLIFVILVILGFFINLT